LFHYGCFFWWVNEGVFFKLVRFVGHMDAPKRVWRAVLRSLTLPLLTMPFRSIGHDTPVDGSGLLFHSGNEFGAFFCNVLLLCEILREVIEVDPNYRATGRESLSGSLAHLGRLVWTSQGVR
jgi:hypothetical protein